MSTVPKLVEGVVYVVQSDNPYGSFFKKGDRVKLLAAPNADGSAAFQYEDGRQFSRWYLYADVLKEAPQKHSKVSKPKVLTKADIRHGVIYVTLKDFPSYSDFKKGARIKLIPGSDASECHFQYEGGGHALNPYVYPEFLAFADVAPVVTAPEFKAATPHDFKPGAVFKVEGRRYYHSCPIGSLVQHTGDFSDISGKFQMEVVTQEGRGTTHYMALIDLSLVVEGKGDVVAPKPKKGTGKPVKTATRSDGYDFVLQDCGPAGYYVEAGCRWFYMADAEKHWQDTRKGTDLGDETFDILNMFKRHIDRLNAKKKKG